MNWAAWEYMVACNKRKDRWRGAVGNKVEGSHRVIYDTRQTPRLTRRTCEFMYGGVVEGGMRGNPTATQIRLQQAYMMHQLLPVQQKMNEHMADVMAYGIMLHKMIEKQRGPWWSVVYNAHPIEFKFYERALRWQSNLTGSGPSVSDTLLHAQDTSRSDGNKSKHGWLSRTPRKSMAWPPSPRTRLIPRPRRLVKPA